MPEYVVDVGTYEWTVPNTNTDLNDTTVNQYYQSAAIAMTFADEFSDKIKLQAEAVAEDTARLNEINNVLSGQVILDWPSSSDPVAVQAASDALKAQGLLPVTENRALVTLVSTSGVTFPNQVVNVGVSSAALAYGGYVIWDPQTGILTGGNGIITDFSSFPENSVLQANTSPPKYFLKIGGAIFDVPTDAQSPYSLRQYEPFQDSPPTQAQIDAVTPDLKKTADNLTQVSQGKQAFLQDLMASLAKWTEFATNLFQRDERNRQDIIGRF